jgi:hypothetical protein
MRHRLLLPLLLAQPAASCAVASVTGADYFSGAAASKMLGNVVSSLVVKPYEDPSDPQLPAKRQAALEGLAPDWTPSASPNLPARLLDDALNDTPQGSHCSQGSPQYSLIKCAVLALVACASLWIGYRARRAFLEGLAP